MKKMIRQILYLLFIVCIAPNILYAQVPCDPGDQQGTCGCPDPSGNCPPHGGTRFTIPIIQPSDPNEIIGPKGVGEKKWVSADATMPYKILFENDPDFATAPAQRVRVYCPIPSHLNPNSLRIGDFGFGSFNFSVPLNTTSYYKRLDVIDSLGVYVDITAGLDQANHRAFWVFESIDSATGLTTTLPPNIGFLPVNDSAIGNGEGFVTLTLQPSSTSVSGDSVNAIASILFDEEDTISTNREFNLIDADKPQSHINALPTSSSNFISLNWSGNDAESGLKTYSIYYSANNGPFQPMLLDTSITSFQFIGQSNTQYSFYSIAKDSAGNTEDTPLTPDAVTHVGNDLLTLNVKAFIEGFYLAFETMTPVLKNQGVIPDNDITDTITVELRNATSPYNVVSTSKALLHTNGLANVVFESVQSGSYFIAVKHRYALQTWSSMPVNIVGPEVSYDFTNSAFKAYGNNMIEVEPGVWAFYTGDINQDENVDIFDLTNLENGISGFNFGYFSADLNGDGNVDLLDSPIMELNINHFIFSNHP